MIRELTRLAHRLDAWLREHLGRPYTVILAIGLVYGIIASMKALIHEAESRFDVFKLVTAVVFQLALLINQLAQFHEYRQEREARKARRTRRSSAAAAPIRGWTGSGGPPRVRSR